MTPREQYQKMHALGKAFNDCKEIKDSPLFQAFAYNLFMSDPGELNISAILSDTYVFQMKWGNIWGDIQWQQCLDESHEIENKYKEQMCTDMLVQILDIIEQRFKEGEKR